MKHPRCYFERAKIVSFMRFLCGAKAVKDSELLAGGAFNEDLDFSFENAGLIIDDPATYVLKNLQQFSDYVKYKKVIKNFFLQENADVARKILPAGFALISAWYAKKDQCPHQPLIIDEVSVLHDFIEKMLKTKIGTEAVCLFFPMREGYCFGRLPLHKTAIKIVKTEVGLDFYHIDSVSNDKIVHEFLCDLIKNKIAIKYSDNYFSIFFFANRNGKPFVRQLDSYSCGYFAMKDARLLKTNLPIDDHLIEEIKVLTDPDNFYRYTVELPCQSLRLTQSISFFSRAELSDAEKLITINKKGETLMAYVNRHIIEQPEIESGKKEKLINSRLLQLDKKFTQLINTIFTKKTRDEIIAEVVAYDAARVSVNELESRYAAWQTRQQQFHFEEKSDAVPVLNAYKI